MKEATTLEAAPPIARRGFVKMNGQMAADRSSREERRWAKKLRRGDSDAMTAIYERYGRITFGFLVKALGDRAVAEDVQQQVFLEVWQHADRFDPSRGSLLTWVMTITRSRAIDQLRRKSPEPLDPSTAVAAVDLKTSEADRFDELAEQWRLRGLLDKLPTSEADLLRFRFYEGLSQTEIAERQGVPLGTVKTRMFRGLRRLRELIEEESK